MQLLQAVLFDLDGTLAHTAPDLCDAVNRVREHFQLEPLPESVVGMMIGNGSRLLVQRALQYAVQDREFIASQLHQAHDLFLTFYRQGFCQRSQLYDGVANTLRALHQCHIPLAVVTNKPEKFIQPLLQHLHIHDYFSACVGGDSLPEKKPHPLPLWHACEKLSASPERCLMVGDSRTDIDAARHARMPVAAVTFGYNHGEDISQCLPDFILETFDALLNVPAVSTRLAGAC